MQAYMCVGVMLVADQYRLGDASPLLELAFTSIGSCSYDYSLTNLPVDQHLQSSTENKLCCYYSLTDLPNDWQ